MKHWGGVRANAKGWSFPPSSVCSAVRFLSSLSVFSQKIKDLKNPETWHLLSEEALGGRAALEV